jgi:hypothetical protein
MGEFVTVKSLPPAVQAALASVSYGRKDIQVQASESVVLAGSAGNGFRAFVVLVNLSTAQHTTHMGSWGGSNMFDRDNPVDNDSRSYPLPANGIAITGRMGGSQPTYATLHVPASMVARILPSAKVALSTVERDALYCHKAIRGGIYRRNELQSRKVPPAVIDDLVTRGLLSRNRAGSVSITTEGKNALGDYRGY